MCWQHALQQTQVGVLEVTAGRAHPWEARSAFVARAGVMPSGSLGPEGAGTGEEVRMAMGSRERCGSLS